MKGKRLRLRLLWSVVVKRSSLRSGNHSVLASQGQRESRSMDVEVESRCMGNGFSVAGGREAVLVSQ